MIPERKHHGHIRFISDSTGAICLSLSVLSFSFSNDTSPNRQAGDGVSS